MPIKIVFQVGNQILFEKYFFGVYLVSEHYISKINIGPVCTISHPTVAPTRNTNSEKREEEENSQREESIKY